MVSLLHIPIMRKNIIKLILALGILLCFTIQIKSQNIGINTTDPKVSLHITASDNASLAEGLIAPSLTRQQLINKDGVYGIDQTNTLIYITDLSGTTTSKTKEITSPGYYFFDGISWQSFSIEPWYKINTSEKAMLNTDSIYQRGKVVIKGNTIGNVNGVPAALTIYTADASFNNVRVGKGNLNLARNTALGYNTLSFDETATANNDLTAIGNHSSGNFTAASGTTFGYSYYPSSKLTTDFVSLSSSFYGNISPFSVKIGAARTSSTDSCNVQIGYINPNGTKNSILIAGYMSLNPTEDSVLLGDSISGNGTRESVYVGTKISTNGATRATVIGSNNRANSTTHLIIANNTSYPYEGSYGVVLGNANITSIRAAETSITSLSDYRVKKNIERNVPGIEFIKRLNPVTYKLDIPSTDQPISKRSPENIRHTGFIAQEVETAAKEIKYNFDGIYVPQNEKDRYGLNYSSFVVPLVKAIQEQQAILAEQQIALSQQKNKLKEQNARLEILSQKLTALEQ